ncbi:MAG: hypothetical protein H0W13_02370, partial [Nitrospirales bacterium]|nr:hypothetical protein [Nitrospirales bacterium]
AEDRPNPRLSKTVQCLFGNSVNLQNIADAIAAFERTIVSSNSAFDKYVMGESNAMDESAIRGMQLFKGKARCMLCHNGHNFTDNQFHNIGVPQEGLLKEDLGRYNVTRRDRDKARSRPRPYGASPRPRPICTTASSRPWKT